MPFTYDVDKSNIKWRVVFHQLSKIRHHTTPSYVPYAQLDVAPNTQVILVSQGQWLEGLVNGTWSTLSDADHR